MGPRCRHGRPRPECLPRRRRQTAQLIPPQGTTSYYQQVTAAMGGRAKTEQFARLFTAPGVGHCRGGSGAAPAEHELPLHGAPVTRSASRPMASRWKLTRNPQSLT
ncbi:tannase/feruloyl esterase family alpha/beta hydrolase [Streptomyces coeruleorubidus]|uniref:tannase/feruloyl esterase family alpha/beta hydrolase n=1 Tax=Streptomyces coeruleorubidus TaxID=116188 RepID=UPI0036B7B713